jgi:Na+/H+-dicarboxylate symporter
MSISIWRSYFRIPLFTRIFIGFGLGIITGLVLWQSSLTYGQEWLADVLAWIAPFGTVLLGMLKMIVIPIIFFSLVTGAANLPVKKFGSLGIRVILWYLITSLGAAVLGTIIAFVLNPGKSAGLEKVERLASTLMPQAEKIGEQVQQGNRLAVFIGNLFKNPFEALATGNFLSIIIFSILFGLAARVLMDTLKDKREKRQVSRLIKVIKAAQEVTFRIVHWIMEYFPIGVFALAAVNFGMYGSALFGPYLKIAGGVIVGVFVMVFIVYPLLMFAFTRRNPYKVLATIQEAVITAFVTRSSAATLPVSMRICEEDLKVKNELAGFSLPLGATINMDGVCVHLPVFAVLAANLFGIEMGPMRIFVLILTVVLASIGAGGVPGGSLMLMFIVLQAMGLSASQTSVIVALAMGINPILDMFETANNVAGDNVCTYVIAQTQKMVSKNGG